MRKNILRQRRGVTLVELTAVMAITAIISLMIVSFSTLISAQVKRNDARADFLRDVSSFRVAAQQQFSAWESGVDAPDSFTVSVDEENKTISFNNNGLSFSDYATIDGVAVETKGGLLKIILTNDDLKAKQSFLLISHCGATFEEVIE